MKLSHKIEISLLDFFKSAKFDYIKLGQNKAWILNNFPDPDDFSSDFLSTKSPIWCYGNIEFHFHEDNTLFLIYSDYISTLDGGPNLALDKWLLEDYTQLTLLNVQSKLNEAQINYHTRIGEGTVRLLLKSGVELMFSNEEAEDIKNPNRFHLSAFSLFKGQAFDF